MQNHLQVWLRKYVLKSSYRTFGNVSGSSPRFCKKLLVGLIPLLHNYRKMDILEQNGALSADQTALENRIDHVSSATFTNLQ